MGAGELAAHPRAHPLPSFLSVTGPGALTRLCEQLADRELLPEDLLRVRVFAKDLSEAVALERELQALLAAPRSPLAAPRSPLAAPRYPATTIVALGQGTGQEVTVDAITAPPSREPNVPPHQEGQPEVVRFGPWVFVGALTAESDPRLPLPERIELEAQGAFARMERALQSTAAELRDVVKVGGWLTFPMSDYPPLGRVREQLLKRSGLLPASSAVQVGAIVPPHDRRHEDAGHDDPGHHDPGHDDPGHHDRAPLLAFEAVAFSPENAPRSGSSIGPPRARVSAPRAPRARVSALASYYTTARSAGGYVFTCGEIPRTRAAIGEQVSDVYEQLQHHLSEHGATLREVVHQTVFVRRSDHIPAVERELGRLLGGAPPPTTLLPVVDMGFREGVGVEIELVAQPTRAIERAR